MNKIIKGHEFGPKLVVDNNKHVKGSAGGVQSCELADLFLSAGQRARGLDEGFDLLDDWLPSFSKVIAMTANECALISEIGIYQSPMTIGASLTFDNTGIATRFLPAGIETIVAVEPDRRGKEPPSLQIFDAEGRGVHKCHIASLSDELAFDVLMYGTREKDLASNLPSPFFRFLSSALKPLGNLPNAGFSQLSVSENLDTCFLFEGRPRHERLQAMDENDAWTIDRQVVPHVLRYLSELRQPLTLGVPSSACLQLKSGRIDDVIRLGEFIELVSDASRIHFDPARIQDFWVVRSDETLSLEGYSKTGACVLVFTQDRAPESHFNKSWINTLQSLPHDRAKAV